MNRAQRRQFKKKNHIDARVFFGNPEEEKVDRSNETICWLHKLPQEPSEQEKKKDKDAMRKYKEAVAKYATKYKLQPWKVHRAITTIEGKTEQVLYQMGRSCPVCHNTVLVVDKVNTLPQRTIEIEEHHKAPETPAPSIITEGLNNG